MTWTPISGTLPQYQKSDGTLASGYYLKFYQAGTTTAFSMATDSTGGTTLAKCQINASGYPINGSSDPFIPHVDQNYKIVLYKNSTDADADTTANAEWVIDNIETYEVGSNDVYGAFSGAPTQTSAITFTLTGDQTSIFSVGTKLRLTDATTVYGIVTASSFSSVTTVTVLATASLTGSLSAVEYAKSTDSGQSRALELDARAYVVPASRTITNNIKIPKGGELIVSAAQALTISGEVEAGLYQIFTGSGSVTGFSAKMILPQWWGAASDGVTDDRAAIALADTEGPIIFTSGTYSVQSSITISNTMTFYPGAKLKPVTGANIKIRGAINAGDYQIFDISAGGTITIETEPRFAKTIWFGVVPSTLGGEIDIATNMQAAVNAVGDNGTLEIMPHRSSYFYHTTAKITLNYNQIGLYSHARISRFRTASDITIFEQTGTKYGLYMRNIQLDSGFGSAGSNSLLVLSGSFLFHLENIYVEDGALHNFAFQGICNSGKIVSCTSEAPDGGDGFNISSTSSMLNFIDCESFAAANSGFSSASGSSKYGIKFIGCRAYANQQHGFSAAGDGDEVIGCMARNNSQAAADTYSGVALGGTGSKVIGGTFLDDQGSPTQKYGVRKSNGTQIVQGISGTGNVSGLYKRADSFELTIASGAITVSGSMKHNVDTEGDASTDDLDTINGGYADYILILSPANSARTVVIKDGTGNIRCAGDFTMDHSNDYIMLYYDDFDNFWYELSRSDNAT